MPSLPLRLATVSQGPDRTQHLSGHRMYLTQAPILVTPGRKGSHIFSVLQTFFFFFFNVTCGILVPGPGTELAALCSGSAAS